MSSSVGFVSKTQHYLKVKKPLLERQRRARINRHLDDLKLLIAEFQEDDAILRMDKAEMLESAIAFMRTKAFKQPRATTSTTTSSNSNNNLDDDSNLQAGSLPMESFRHGYMNAVNEVSRVMAATPGMSVELGKAVMTHLGFQFNRLLHCQVASATAYASSQGRAASPASSGYHSDCEDSPMPSPAPSMSSLSSSSTVTSSASASKPVWRPW